ncbi:MAG: uncharacterized protein KVP18_002839 [Porospora cf. gigantea A]|uniref:uncharacterized protein n=2 Tax=Porospora cf. gigantea A TaxID=2853593 RepID=UPI0035595DE0|nr:MAG: hypothetical protein KVP18_002839 [Porospora cf. gigantea A]
MDMCDVRKAQWERQSMDMSDVRRALLEKQANDPFLQENVNRWVILPLEFEPMWTAFKAYQDTFWASEDVQADQEMALLESAAENLPLNFISSLTNVILLRSALVHGRSPEDEPILADLTEITCELLSEIQIPEARAFFSFQGSYEVIHKEAFNAFLPVLLTGQTGLDVTAEEHRPIATAMEAYCQAGEDKAQWILRHCKNDATPKPMAEKLAAYAILKMMMSADILMINGLLSKAGVDGALSKGLSNIIRQEQLQGVFAATLYSGLRDRLTDTVLDFLLNEAIALETAHLKRVGLVAAQGMVEWLAQRVKVALGAASTIDGSQTYAFLGLAPVSVPVPPKRVPANLKDKKPEEAKTFALGEDF